MNTISVIIPVYNGTDYILETIASVKSQTLAPIEIIIVDDGSTDGTSDKVKSIPGVTLVVQANRGPSAARNRGAAVASGDWLAFLDADDVWHPEKLKVQSELFFDDTTLVYCNRTNIGDLGGRSVLQSEGVTLYEGEVFSKLLEEGNFITASSVVISRRVFQACGGFCEDEEILGVEDWDLWLQASRLGKVRRSMEPLVQYRIHSSGLSRNIRKMCNAQLQVLQRVSDWTAESQTSSLKRSIKLSKANTYHTWGFFAANGKDYQLSRKLYAQAILIDPKNLQSWKGLLKAFLGRY
jgi:glycosyltransferase involved in cell wall biosynthesis